MALQVVCLYSHIPFADAHDERIARWVAPLLIDGRLHTKFDHCQRVQGVPLELAHMIEAHTRHLLGGRFLRFASAGMYRPCSLHDRSLCRVVESWQGHFGEEGIQYRSVSSRSSKKPSR